MAPIPYGGSGETFLPDADIAPLTLVPTWHESRKMEAKRNHLTHCRVRSYRCRLHVEQIGPSRSPSPAHWNWDDKARPHCNILAPYLRCSIRDFKCTTQSAGDRRALRPTELTLVFFFALEPCDPGEDEPWLDEDPVSSALASVSDPEVRPPARGSGEGDLLRASLDGEITSTSSRGFVSSHDAGRLGVWGSCTGSGLGSTGPAGGNFQNLDLGSSGTNSQRNVMQEHLKTLDRPDGQVV